MSRAVSRHILSPRARTAIAPWSPAVVFQAWHATGAGLGTIVPVQERTTPGWKEKNDDRRLVRKRLRRGSGTDLDVARHPQARREDHRDRGPGLHRHDGLRSDQDQGIHRLYRAADRAGRQRVRQSRRGQGRAAGDRGAAELESEVRLIRSAHVIAKVIDELDLTLGKSEPSAVDTVFSWLGVAAASSDEEVVGELETGKQLEEFRKRLTIERDPLAYVLSVGYKSTDRAEAALVANTLARVYLEGSGGLQAPGARRDRRESRAQRRRASPAG